MNSLLRRSWVEVNLDTIINNYKLYKRESLNDNEIMAVVKADAYGHGAVEVSSHLQENGIKHFAVSNLLEAIQLRKEGIEGQILVLGYTPLENMQQVFEYDITQTIVSADYSKKVIESGFPIKCQVAIDTGMNRIGLDADDVKACELEIRKINKKLILTGVFTHLCVADTITEKCKKFTEQQISKFRSVVDSVADLQLSYIHCLNSAGGLRYDSVGNLTRLGIVMYGLKPDYDNVLPSGIKPALEWKSIVSMVKKVHSGESVGYGMTYTAEEEKIIATIPTGYADGYNRALSNRGYVLLHGKKAPIVGRICMDQFMVDVTDIPGVLVDDEIVLLGNSEKEMLTAGEMAQMIGSIGYEVVCNISKRVPRVYKYDCN